MFFFSCVLQPDLLCQLLYSTAITDIECVSMYHNLPCDNTETVVYLKLGEKVAGT